MVIEEVEVEMKKVDDGQVIDGNGKVNGQSITDNEQVNEQVYMKRKVSVYGKGMMEKHWSSGTGGYRSRLRINLPFTFMYHPRGVVESVHRWPSGHRSDSLGFIRTGFFRWRRCLEELQ